MDHPVLAITLAFIDAIKKVFSDLVVFKIFGGLIIALIGPPGPIVNALIIIIFLDSLTGIWKSVKKGNFNGAKLYNMFGKWLFYFILLAAANASLSIALCKIWVRDGIAGFIFLTELNSVLENLRCLGFPAPSVKTIRESIKNIIGGKNGNSK